MKIAAHLGALDEVELIDAVVDHLAAIGVDHVVAFDSGSSDGTLEALERRVGPGFELERLRNDTPFAEFQARTVAAVRATGADWVLFLDADEFWFTAGGSLRSWLDRVEADIVTVPRYNVALTDDGPALPAAPSAADHDRILLHARPIPNFRERMLAHPETPWISGVPHPKVVARTDFIEQVGMGGHNVVGRKGRVPRRLVAHDAVVAHVPYSTLARFEKRLGNIREFLALSPDYLSGTQGWHWKRLDEIARRGEAAVEFERQRSDPEALARARADGWVRSVAEVLGEA